MLNKLFKTAAIALAASLAVAHAAYPEQPIKLVVGFPPGGGGDLYGRMIATELAKTVGQPVVVDNRAGANGNIAADAVARARPDGYTLLLALAGNISVAPVVKPQTIGYKVPDSFAPIGLMLEAPHGMFVAKNSRFANARDFFTAAKTEKLSCASTGAGGASHMALEMAKQATQTTVLHVPYKGSGPALTDLLGGQIDCFFAPASALVGAVRQGQLRLLAISGGQRSPAIAEVPTFNELGIPVPITQWYGLLAPAGTPDKVIDHLSEHLSRALKQPEVIATIQKDAAMEKDLPRARFRDFIVRDMAQYRRILTPELSRELTQ